MGQLAKALSYKPKGHEFDSASKRNEYLLGDKVGWCLGLKTLLPACAVILEIWESDYFGNLRDSSCIKGGCFSFNTLCTSWFCHIPHVHNFLSTGLNLLDSASSLL